MRDVVGYDHTDAEERTLALDPDSHEVFLVGAQKVAKGTPVEGFEMLVVAGK